MNPETTLLYLFHGNKIFVDSITERFVVVKKIDFLAVFGSRKLHILEQERRASKRAVYPGVVCTFRPFFEQRNEIT